MAAVFPMRAKNGGPSADQLLTSIRRDDWPAMQRHLEQCSDVTAFLTSPLPCPESVPVAEANFLSAVILHVRQHTRSPLLVVALYGARRILSHLLGIDGTEDLVSCMAAGRTDSVLHALCLGSVLRLQASDRYLECFETLRTKLSPEQMQRLIRAENSIGLRPLEFSVLLDEYQLFLALLSCYVTERIDDGLVVTETYDLSEYHPLAKGSRVAVSPIRLLCEAKAVDVVRMDEANLFNHDVVREWRHQIFVRCTPVITIIALLLVFAGISTCFVVMPTIYKSIYELVDRALRNANTNVAIPKLLNCNISVYIKHSSASFLEQNLDDLAFMRYTSFLIYSFDFVSHICGYVFRWLRWKKFSHFFKQQPKVINDVLYNFIMTGTLCSSALYLVDINSIFFITESRVSSLLFVLDLTMCVSTVCVLIHLIMILEMIPGIGGRALQLRSTITVTLGFSAVYCFWLFVFGSLFYYATPCTRRSDPITVLESFYEVFNLSLNIVNYSQLDMERIQVLHLVFVLLAPMSLVNFMIAIMTNKITFIHEHEDLMMELNRQEGLFLPECGFLVPGVGKLLRRIHDRIYKRQPEMLINRSFVLKTPIPKL